MGPLIPLFWTSDDVSPGFQSQGALSPAACSCHLSVKAAFTPNVSISIDAFEGIN